MPRKSKKLLTLEANAAAGDASSLRQLAHIVIEGELGVKKDLERGMELYHKAANAGDVDAQSILGINYFLGIFIKQDFSKALEFFTKAAEQHNAASQYYLGVMYNSGEHGIQKSVKNDEISLAYFRASAEQGYHQAQYTMGIYYYSVKSAKTEINHQLAASLFRKAADQDHSAAYFELGRLYNFGQGVKQNQDTALEHFIKAAELGYIPAHNEAGILYESRHDLKAAIPHYISGANEGDEYALANVKRLHEYLTTPTRVGLPRHHYGDLPAVPAGCIGYNYMLREETDMLIDYLHTEKSFFSEGHSKKLERIPTSKLRPLPSP